MSNIQAIIQNINSDSEGHVISIELMLCHQKFGEPMEDFKGNKLKIDKPHDAK